jgi:hypothetical protein
MALSANAHELLDASMPGAAIKPPLTQESQPEDVNELLGYFLGEDAMLRQSYRRSIGQ